MTMAILMPRTVYRMPLAFRRESITARRIDPVRTAADGMAERDRPMSGRQSYGPIQDRNGIVCGSRPRAAQVQSVPGCGERWHEDGEFADQGPRRLGPI